MSGNERSITDSAHGILKQEDEPAFEDVSCPILSGVGVRLWRGLEVGGTTRSSTENARPLISAA